MDSANLLSPPKQVSLAVHTFDRPECLSEAELAVFNRAREVLVQNGVRLIEETDVEALFSSGCSHVALAVDLDKVPSPKIYQVAVLTPVALIECFEHRIRLPTTPPPTGLHSNCMKNVFVTTTGLSRTDRDHLFRCVRRMTGRASDMFVNGVTHLISTPDAIKGMIRQGNLSLKYQVAFRREIPVVNAKWIVQTYQQSRIRVGLNALDQVNQHLLRPFEQIKISICPKFECGELKQQLLNIVEQLTGTCSDSDYDIQICSKQGDYGIDFRWILDSQLAQFVLDPRFYRRSHPSDEHSNQFKYDDDHNTHFESMKRLSAFKGDWDFVDSCMDDDDLRDETVFCEFPWLKFRSWSIVGIPETSRHFGWISRLLKSGQSDCGEGSVHLVICPMVVPPCADSYFRAFSSVSLMNISALSSISQGRFDESVFPREPIVYRSWGRRPLEGCVLSLSGFKPRTDYRSFVREIGRFLGADVDQTEQLVRTTSRASTSLDDDRKKNTTHLLVADVGTASSSTKFQAATRWGIYVLRADWLVQCFKEGQRVDERGFSLVERISQAENRDEAVVDVAKDDCLSKISSFLYSSPFVSGGRLCRSSAGIGVGAGFDGSAVLEFSLNGGDCDVDQKSFERSVSRRIDDSVGFCGRRSGLEFSFVYSTPPGPRNQPTKTSAVPDRSVLAFNARDIEQRSKSVQFELDGLESVGRGGWRRRPPQTPQSKCLDNVVVAFSRTLARHHVEYSELVECLGGRVVSGVACGGGCTHFVTSFDNPVVTGNRRQRVQKFRLVVDEEIKDARSRGLLVVLPSWLFGCRSRRVRLDESLYFPDKDAAEFGQGLGVLPLRRRSSSDEVVSARRRWSSSNRVLNAADVDSASSRDLFNLEADEDVEQSVKRTRSAVGLVAGGKGSVKLTKYSVMNIEYVDSRAEEMKRILFEE